MMARLIDSIFSISMVVPDLVGEKLELPVVRPVIKAVMGDGALAVNLLQTMSHRIRDLNAGMAGREAVRS